MVANRPHTRQRGESPRVNTAYRRRPICSPPGWSTSPADFSSEVAVAALWLTTCKNRLRPELTLGSTGLCHDSCGSKRRLEADFQIHDSARDGVAGHGGNLVQVQLAHERLAVLFHRLLRDREQAGHLFGAISLGNQLKPFGLARAQSPEPGNE